MWRPIALIALAALPGCRDETLSGYAGTDRHWTLVELNGRPFDATAQLRFPEAGRIAGRAPCNSFSGRIEAPYPWFEVGPLEVGPLAVTRRACPDLRAEAAFLDALQAARLAEISGPLLILSNAAGLEMVFRAE